MKYSVYIIRLRADILKHKKFRRENPGHLPHKPCVYVGSTRLQPEKRYERQIDPKSKVGSKWVKRYHVTLHKRLTEKQPKFQTREEAEMHEKVLTQRLRKRGYAVWSR